MERIMDHFIDRIVIDNFKSIHHLEISGLKRINLFIGRPNVGKSNILEALALLSTSWKKLTDIVRIGNLRELHYNGNIDEKSFILIQRKDNKGYIEYCDIAFLKSQSQSLISLNLGNVDYPEDPHKNDRYNYILDDSFEILSHSVYTSIISEEPKKYVYKHEIKFRDVHLPYLSPPFGENILYILEIYPELRKLYAQWFRQYGLRLVLDTASQSLKVQKEKGEDEVFQLPYSSVADTLQRIIFYKTAVASNENSVLLFEEPEAHAFPPYIVEFTQEVIQSLTNQFFIVTHSPLIVEEFLTDAIDDLGIFNVDFKDGQTVVRTLTTEEIYDVRKYGVDLFFNNEAYLS